ncbi:MAG: hypothetical protein VKQ33_01135 [Candidatus Sericytochromatia bacterium]|nr:hypothetical protein [Candidatus Sericytochromatia bacterium]
MPLDPPALLSTSLVPEAPAPDPEPEGATAATRRRAVDHFLADGWRADQVEALQLNHGFHALFPLFLALTRGANEAAFVVRVAFIRELFASCRERFWDKEAMQRVLPWLHPDALDHLVTTFRQYGWLEFDRARGYYWTEMGVNAAAMLGMLAQASPQRQEMGIALYGVEFCLQMGYDPLDVLYNLRSRFDVLAQMLLEALDSHSEVRLVAVQDQLDQCLALSQETRRVLDGLDLSRREIQHEYQAIHLHLSQLHAYRSELIRVLTGMGEQFVSLEGGINQLDITRMLMAADVDALAAVAAEAFRCPAFIPPFFDESLLLSAAEYHLFRELIEVEEEEWNEPVPAATTTLVTHNRETIAEAVADLERYAHARGPVPLFEYATVDEPALAMYRLSLLPLVGTPVAPGERTDSPVQRLKLVPLGLDRPEDASLLVAPTPFIKEITEAYLRPHALPRKDAHGRAV